MNEWEWNLLEDKSTLDQIEIDGVTVRPGSRVRLAPKEGGDILDLALRGQTAIVECIEEDYENAKHVCVVLEIDPGRDLGMLRQPGHRFFFTPAEIEPLVDQAVPVSASVNRCAPVQAAVLIAGIGNIFLGDDGFGVEVARRLLARPQREAVRVVDFGIRGFDLAYALQDGYATTILVDAYPHGQPPGTVTVIEPDLENLSEGSSDFVQPHAMNPMNVLRMARAMIGTTRRIILVGCEPLTLGPEEGHMGLSDPVESAVDGAVNKIDLLVKQILSGEQI
jgi:hydrogenase maturation protease